MNKNKIKLFDKLIDGLITIKNISKRKHTLVLQKNKIKYTIQVAKKYIKFQQSHKEDGDLSYVIKFNKRSTIYKTIVRSFNYLAITNPKLCKEKEEFHNKKYDKINFYKLLFLNLLTEKEIEKLIIRSQILLIDKV